MRTWSADLNALRACAVQFQRPQMRSGHEQGTYEERHAQRLGDLELRSTYQGHATQSSSPFPVPSSGRRTPRDPPIVAVRLSHDGGDRSRNGSFTCRDGPVLEIVRRKPTVLGRRQQLTSAGSHRIEPLRVVDVRSQAMDADVVEDGPTLVPVQVVHEHASGMARMQGLDRAGRKPRDGLSSDVQESQRMVPPACVLERTGDPEPSGTSAHHRDGARHLESADGKQVLIQSVDHAPRPIGHPEPHRSWSRPREPGCRCAVQNPGEGGDEAQGEGDESGEESPHAGRTGAGRSRLHVACRKSQRSAGISAERPSLSGSPSAQRSAEGSAEVRSLRRRARGPPTRASAA